MATTHKIIFYPVGHGDTCQIITASGRRFLFDFCHRKSAQDKDDPRIDLKTRLKTELREAKRDYFDMVAFSHADIDHICGSTDFFELQHAAKYQGNDRIKIDELWVPAAILVDAPTRDEMSHEFAIWRREARHRLLEGKGIKVFSKPEALMEWLRPALIARGEPTTARDHLFVDAGTLVDTYSLAFDGVEFFSHAPFIKHCDGKRIICNDASIVLNIRFRADGQHYDFLQIGDSTWGVLEDIVEITKAHGNEDRLAWNLFNIPHHCSYLALSDDKGEKETEPKPLVKELLLYGKAGSYIVSSSCPVPDSRDMYTAIQPPHIQARKAYQTYCDKVGGRDVLVTMEQPNAAKPEPLTFEVTWGGISWIKAIAGAAAIIGTAAPRAGLETRSARAG